MSLINEALKRARHQALEQEADGSVVSYRAVPAHSRNPRPPWLPYLIGGGVVAIAVLAVSVLRHDDGPAANVVTPGPPTAVSTASQAAVDPAPPAAGDAGESGPRGRGAAVASSPPPNEESANEPAEQSQATASRPQEEAKSVPAPPDGPRGQRREVASPPVVEQAAGARLEDGKSYLRRVVAKDGSEVVLSGIAYSEIRPNAVINGSIVTPGDMISGFTVVAITPGHVELEADGVKILLTLH